MSQSPGSSVDVLICTFRRPSVVATMRSVADQRLPAGTAIRIVVADNDTTPSSKDMVQRASDTLGVPVTYVHAPSRNISIARNACLDAAQAEWIAFIDDDEVADLDWLNELLVRANETGADAVFGPAYADYPADAPDWMRQQDSHSNIPVTRNGAVETGHTCNALLRWRHTPWQDDRFDLERGRTGGEDTAFFFRLRNQGARFAIAQNAIVREPVTPERLDMRWLLRRKFRMGQSHAAGTLGRGGLARLALTAAAKSVFCAFRAAASAPFRDQRNFWTLRMALHGGVVAGCLSLPEQELYGKSSE